MGQDHVAPFCSNNNLWHEWLDNEVPNTSYSGGLHRALTFSCHQPSITGVRMQEPPTSPCHARGDDRQQALRAGKEGSKSASAAALAKQHLQKLHGQCFTLSLQDLTE